jgi:hypothetical protein
MTSLPLGGIESLKAKADDELAGLIDKLMKVLGYGNARTHGHKTISD